MFSVETESIVLRSYDLAEADRIVVLLTRDHGLIRGVAKGAKRLNSRFGSGLEPFAVSRVTYRQKEGVELATIERCELIRSHFPDASDPDFLGRFAYLGDLLASFTPPQDPNETLYRMVRACLDAAAAEPGHLDSVTAYFKIWLLRIAGFLPDWSVCSRCRTPIATEGNMVLDANFYLNCNVCGGSRGLQVTPIQRRLFSAVMTNAPAAFIGIANNNEASLGDLDAVLNRLTSRSLGREVAAARSPALG